MDSFNADLQESFNHLYPPPGNIWHRFRGGSPCSALVCHDGRYYAVELDVYRKTGGAYRLRPPGRIMRDVGMHGYFLVKITESWSDPVCAVIPAAEYCDMYDAGTREIAEKDLTAYVGRILYSPAGHWNLIPFFGRSRSKKVVGDG